MKNSIQKMEEAKGIRKGEIGYYGLDDWWRNTFTEEERKIIMNTYPCRQVGLANPQIVHSFCCYTTV